MTQVLAFSAAVILIFVGAAGVILPFLPGVPLAWLGMLIYAIATGFTEISVTLLLVFLGLTILTIVFDIAAPILGAKRWNASRYGMIGATLGLIFGVFIAGPIGILLGPIVGAYLGEVLMGKDREGAMKSAFGTFIGLLAGTVLKLGIIFAMAGFMIASLR